MILDADLSEIYVSYIKPTVDKEMSDTSTNAVENRVIKQYVDNSAGIQPDYNQNDSTARDYIKNRPFYKELVEGEVVYEKTFTPTEVSDGTHTFYQFIDNDTDFELKAGDIYEVTFNGTKYLDSIFTLDSILTCDSVGYIWLVAEAEPNTDANPFALLGFDLTSMSVEAIISAKINIVTKNINETTISIKKLFSGPSLYSANNLTFTNVGESGSMAVVDYKEGLPDEMYLTIGDQGEQINQFDEASVYNFTKNNVSYVVRVWGNAAPCQAYVDQNFDGLIKFKNTNEFFGVVMATTSDGNNFGAVTSMGISSGSVELFSVSNYEDRLVTIDPKYIKDMYYENQVKTILFNSTFSTTKVSSDYEGELEPSFEMGVDGDEIEVNFNSSRYMLPVYTLGNTWLIGDSELQKYPFYIMTSDSKTTIKTKEQHTDAFLKVTLIHDDIHKVPTKYINIEGPEVTIEVSENANKDEIGNALKEYLNNNSDIVDALRNTKLWTLNFIMGGTKVTAVFTSYYQLPLIRQYRLDFITIYQDYDIFNPDPPISIQSMGITFSDIGSNNIKEVVILEGQVYNSITNQLMAVTQKDVDNFQGDKYDLGRLDIYYKNSDQGALWHPVKQGVFLKDWIEASQQREDFEVPTPTKNTDLVDKQYVDGKFAIGTDGTIEIKIGNDTYVVQATKKETT